MIFMDKIDTSRFFRVYSNLPLKVRQEIVVVLDTEPITWSVAFKEISINTKKGEEIFKKLVELKII